MVVRCPGCEHGVMSRGSFPPFRWRFVALGLLAAVVVGFGVGESMGWPFLGGPMQHWIGKAIDRRVSFNADPAAAPAVRLHLLGGIEVQAAHIEIGAPQWSTAPHMLRARDAQLTLGYGDLIRAAFGAPLRIRELRAAELDGHLERQADGRASWQFGPKTDTPDNSEPPVRLPVFGRLAVGAGSVVVRDALMALDLAGQFSLTDSSQAAAGSTKGMQFSGKGMYRQQPMTIEMQTNGVLAVVADDAASAALPVTLNVKSGAASLSFKGTATDALKLTALKGRFVVQGPSLAAVGDPLRVTLPTTGPFRAEGLIAKQGLVWNALFNQVSVGSSRLAGAFTYDPRPRLPLLSGRLTATNLMLADLGPAVGAPVRKGPAPVVVPASALPKTSAKPGHVLPNREFDLPALRAMDANVLIDIDNFDLGSGLLQPLKPARTHLVLADGVLTLREFEARTAQGRLAGMVQLDGRDAQALWTADLRWDGVRLESWIHQERKDDSAPPYVTGTLNGRARVAGQGKSTAAILGSLRGETRMHVVGGTISHLAVEAAGLDIAQGLGLLIKGDDALPIQCTVVDLVAEQGLFRPRAFVLDTDDSTLLVDGSLSLATEELDLRVVTTPKDFSPLALRTPLHVRGTFANPSISLDKGRLGTRLGASAMLSLLNPLAALIPLIDFGNSDDAKHGADACRALSQRIKTRPALAAPSVAPRPAVKRAG